MKKFNVIAKEWFDKMNGNSYFSVRITNNKTGKVIALPFQYGYGDHYRDMARAAMVKEGWISKKYEKDTFMHDRENDYPVDYFKSGKCLLRDVKAWGVI